MFLVFTNGSSICSHLLNSQQSTFLPVSQPDTILWHTSPILSPTSAPCKLFWVEEWWNSVRLHALHAHVQGFFCLIWPLLLFFCPVEQSWDSKTALNWHWRLINVYINFHLSMNHQVKNQCSHALIGTHFRHLIRFNIYFFNFWMTELKMYFMKAKLTFHEGQAYIFFYIFFWVVCVRSEGHCSGTLLQNEKHTQ